MKRALLLVAACSGAPVAPPSPTVAVPEAKLPAAEGRFLPALAEVQGGGDMTGLAAVEGCGSCHVDVASQWQSSAHSFASFNNPIYRVSVERLRHDRGARPSRFCGGCHDVALLFEGALDGEVAPSDPRAHTGVTCRTCHSVV